MITKIDLHNHSIYSEDSTAEPEESIERAIEVGLDGIAFTEHNSYEASEPVERLKERYRDRISIFRGAEYATAEGHVLLFGIRDDRFLGIGEAAPVREVVRFVTDRGGIVIVPHPYREWSLMRADLGSLNGICAIEAYNHHNNRTENDKAMRAARVLQLPTTGGSDSHAREEVGGCYTEFFMLVTHHNFIDALRGGRYRGVDRHEPERPLR
ncbi:MAG: PHP domain-containing protein [Nitrospirota bacterium]